MGRGSYDKRISEVFQGFPSYSFFFFLGGGGGEGEGEGEGREYHSDKGYDM